MNNRDNLLGIFSVIYRWRKAILTLCLVTLLGSIGISLLLDNYYKATTIFYPASPELANPDLIFGNSGQVTNYFGSDRDLDRLAEIANSTEVVDYMVKRFKLFEHYEYDSTTQKGAFMVRDRFRSLYTAQKNKNDAIELSIEDTDPDQAAEMANAARSRINQLGQRLIKNSQATLLATFEDNIKRKNAELVLLGDSLRDLQIKYGLYSVGAQGERLSTMLTQAESEIIRGNARLEILENNPAIPRDTIAYIKGNIRAYERERQNLKSTVGGDNFNLKRFNEGFSKVTVLGDLHFQARKQLSYDQERYNQIKSAFKTDIPAIQLVEAAEPPLVKSRPRRSIIVVAAVLAAFMFAVLGILMVDAFRDVNWKNVLQN